MPRKPRTPNPRTTRTKHPKRPSPRRKVRRKALPSNAGVAITLAWLAVGLALIAGLLLMRDRQIESLVDVLDLALFPLTYLTKYYIAVVVPALACPVFVVLHVAS